MTATLLVLICLSSFSLQAKSRMRHLVEKTGDQMRLHQQRERYAVGGAPQVRVMVDVVGRTPVHINGIGDVEDCIDDRRHRNEVDIDNRPRLNEYVSEQYG